jgi:hypothetical protein
MVETEGKGELGRESVLLEEVRCDGVNRIHLALESSFEHGNEHLGSIKCGNFLIS